MTDILDLNGEKIKAPQTPKELKIETDAEYYKRLCDVLLQSMKFIYKEPERLGPFKHVNITKTYKVTAWKVAKDTLEWYVDEQTARNEMQKAFDEAHAKQNPKDKPNA